MRLPAISLICLTLALAGAGAIATGSVAAKPTIQAAIPAPPEPIYEVDPGERLGYTWSPGFWRWNGKEHIWTAGHWIKDRPGYRWMSDGWEQRGDSWRFVKGHWEKGESDLIADEDEPFVTDPAARGTSATSPQKPVKRYRRIPNYRNARLYPPVVHH